MPQQQQPCTAKLQKFTSKTITAKSQYLKQWKREIYVLNLHYNSRYYISSLPEAYILQIRFLKNEKFQHLIDFLLAHWVQDWWMICYKMKANWTFKKIITISSYKTMSCKHYKSKWRDAIPKTQIITFVACFHETISFLACYHKGVNYNTSIQSTLITTLVDWIWYYST